MEMYINHNSAQIQSFISRYVRNFRGEYMNKDSITISEGGVVDARIQKMFEYPSKMLSVAPPERIASYKRLYHYLKDAQAKGVIPVHHNYLGGNDLAINIYRKKYFLKDLDIQPIEEKPEDVFVRLSAFMAAMETSEKKQNEWVVKFYTDLFEGRFLPGGRVIAGAGDLYRLKTLANCFVSLIDGDNIESIYKTAYECARTYSFGGGIGVDISVLRPKGSVVHNAADNSTGSVSFMEIYSLTTGLIGQSGRRGALMLTLDVKHPDVMEFINVKKVPNWVTKQIIEQCSWSGSFDEKQLKVIESQVRENTQVRFANISLKVSDEFMQAVDEQKKFGPNAYVVYKKKNKAVISGARQGTDIHYSYGIPARSLDDYEFVAHYASAQDLSKDLSLKYKVMFDTALLDDSTKRDMFGDYVLSPPGKEYDLTIRRAGDFLLYFNSKHTGEIKRLVKARNVWNAFVEGNYRTAEPGLIFWTSMSKYSPSNYVGRPIASTNPCVAADSLISTEFGLERIDCVKAPRITVDNRTENQDNELVTEQLGTQLVKPLQIIKTGIKDCLKLETVSGYEITATPDHKILTTRGWKELGDISDQDSVFIQSGQGSFSNIPKLPFAVKNSIIGKNGHTYELNLPAQWSKELGLLLGWAIGDGFLSKNKKFGLVFAKQDEQVKSIIQPILEKYCNRSIKAAAYQNGCVQIRSSSKYLIEFLKTLGIKEAHQEREVPASLFTAPIDAVVGFLEGLFSSDGTVGLGSKSRNYVRLNSSSLKLLKGVQLLLLNLGVRSSIYDRSTISKIFRYENVKGEVIKYKTSGVNYELNISKENVLKLLHNMSFLQQRQKDKTARLEEFTFYHEHFTDRVKRISSAGEREVWDITEPQTHSFIANGIVVHNCGEVPLEDGGACNLGSINLSRFVKDGYENNACIDWDALKHSTNVITRFLDNVVSWNENLNPLEKQRVAASETRRLGIGVMGIADMFNQLGIDYDSPKGLDLLETIGKFIANEAYQASAMLAKEKAPTPLWDYNKYARGAFFQENLSQETQGMIKENGLRNIAILSIAPTGTISNVILGYTYGDKNYIGVSGGIEPVFALFYTRRSESFGNKFFNVFHATVQAYIDLKNLSDEVKEARKEDDLHGKLPSYFFKTAHHIDPAMRVKVQGIMQKYIDHSISSTVNLPEDIEPETISDVYLDAWREGLKGITIYRDGSRYPILSVEGRKSDFQDNKEKMFTVMDDKGKPLTARGDHIIALADGSLTTVYHLVKAGMRTLQEQETAQKVHAPPPKQSDEKIDESKLLKCPACSKMTFRNDGGCATCIDPECGFGKCDS